MTDEQNNGIVDLTHRLGLLPPTGDGDDQSVIGADDDEIRDLEDELGARLPLVYRQFLRAMGHSAGPLFDGSDCSLTQRHRLRLRPSAERIIQRSAAGWQLPDDAFVFLVHHGYQFLFFRLSEGDNPPIYRFSDADDAAIRIAPSLTEFLKTRMEEHEHIVHTYLTDQTAAEGART